jgi:predicted transcriptional regulator
LKEEQLKILKFMTQATNRMDLTMFAQSVNLEPNQVMQNVQELAKEGFVCKVSSGYGVTEKGKNALKAFIPLEENMSFHFYTRIGYPTVFSAQSLADFYRLSRQIEAESLEFHLYRGDFENWLKDAYNDEELAEKLNKLKEADIKGEELRKETLNAIDQKYNIKDLL